jgi:hypothetical protein
MERIAPIFAVHDLDVAMEHYQQLGFTVRAYAGGGYATPPARWRRSFSSLGRRPSATFPRRVDETEAFCVQHR